MSTAVAEADPTSPDTAPLGHRWLLGAALAALVLAFAQVPGLIVADTKYDLTQNPLGLLARAAHQWSSQSTLGQVQNQAYGYFFPHGSFFALGDLLAVPPWVTQRLWWAVLLLAGFWGIVRLAETIGVGSRTSRIVAATAFVLCPRVITTLGSISSETLPLMLAPWVLLGPAALAREQVCVRRAAAWSAVAVALMGAVNAVATMAAVLPAVLWWLALRPNPRWRRFTAWWLPCLLLATCWWLVALLLLGRVSPPFLDFIESAGVTTQWASLPEVLRGTTSWTPFVSPERVAGAVLVTQPAAVIATGAVAAAGIAGLAMRAMPAKGRLTLILLVGLAGITAGYVGGLGSPFAEPVRAFLDAGGAPLRNVHKLEPLIRLPLVLGLAHLLARVPLPGSVPTRRWRSALAHPEREPMVAVAGLVLVALAMSTALAWTGRLAPRGAYEAVPQYWHEVADWLADNADGQRALVVPGAPFGSQVWGLTRDEPLQALARTPWAVRDAIPLNPPGAIRALDSVQRLFADGRGSAGLAATLADQGIGYLVVRNDLDPDTSRSARPVLVHQTLAQSGDFERVATFGEDIEAPTLDDVVTDSDLRPSYPAVEVFRVDPGGAASEGSPDTPYASEGPPDTGGGSAFPDSAGASEGSPDTASASEGSPDTGGAAAPGSTHTGGIGPYLVDVDDVPRVQGGPEAVLRMRESGGSGPSMLAADAAAAGLPVDDVTVTDTPMDRETDYGQVDHHSSAIRAEGDERRTYNRVPDYPVAGADLVRGEWSGARITVSSSASDATQLGGTLPGSGPPATVDGDTATSWLSNGLESAVGQWLQLDLDTPITSGLLRVTTSTATIGSPVKWIEIRTPNGTAAGRITEPGAPITIALPPGTTPWIRIVATQTENGSVGNQFGIAEVAVEDHSDPDHPVPVDIGHRVVLPPTPAGADVTAWQLGQELPGSPACVDAPDRVRCAPTLALPPEEWGTFTRTLDVPVATEVRPELTVRARPGPTLDALLTEPDRAVASGLSDVADPRGSAFAATDGDPRTSWTAAQETVNQAGVKPTLEIALPRPELVTGLRLDAALGRLPVAPTSVAVDLGAGPQVRAVDPDDPTVGLFPVVTDHITLSLQSWDPILDRTALGFPQGAAPGLAEVTVLGADGVPIFGGTTDPDRLVTIGCADGPVVDVAGVSVRTSITATVEQLRSAIPVSAVPCSGAAPDPAVRTALPAGHPDVVVRPGPEFFVDSLRLDTGAATPTPVRTTPETGDWSANHRVLDAPAGDRDRLVVVPESVNVGWRATAADGTVLDPVTVDGWQQGWLLPAGIGGPITLDYPTDRWYRLGIFGGLVLLVPLFALALWPRRRMDLGPAPRPWRSRVAGVLGVCAVGTVASGPVGLAAAVATLVAAALIERRWGTATRTKVLVVVAGAGTGLSMLLLSRGPWRSPDGYLGHAAWVQFPALSGVLAVGAAALAGAALWPRFVPPMDQDRSSRRTANRTGSSTSA